MHSFREEHLLPSTKPEKISILYTVDMASGLGGFILYFYIGVKVTEPKYRIQREPLSGSRITQPQ